MMKYINRILIILVIAFCLTSCGSGVNICAENWNNQMHTVAVLYEVNSSVCDSPNLNFQQRVSCIQFAEEQQIAGIDMAIESKKCCENPGLCPGLAMK